jgi:perosamine synthetase
MSAHDSGPSLPPARRWRYVAPAGAPLRLRDLAGAARVFVTPGDHGAALAARVAAQVGAPYAAVVSTGRAGLCLLMQALADLRRDRDEVIVPSYTCFSVPASIIKAGLRPRIVDIDPATLDYDHAQLAGQGFSRVLAIVATNLYGLPNDLPRLARLAAEVDAFLVDDAAQSLGATMGGRACGTWGDAGLFSLDKGKNVSAIDGGILVTGNEAIADGLRRRVAALPAPHLPETLLDGVKLAAYASLLHPSLYWLPNSVPQLGLGTTPFTLDYPVQRQSRLLASVGLIAIERLEWLTEQRRTRARALMASLVGLPGIRGIVPVEGAEPAWLRYPVLFDDPAVRDEAIAALRARGIGATGSYPLALADVPELREYASAGASGGRHVASRVLTLPTHPYVSEADVDVTVRTLRGLLDGRRASAAPASALVEPLR